MISSLVPSVVLLATGLFASPVIISNVSIEREAERLRVDVSASGGIDPEGAKTAVVDGRILLQLGGTRVKANLRSWQVAGSDDEIRAHRHSEYTELVVPVAERGCTGPIELVPTAEGLSAFVGCNGTKAARRGAVANAETEAEAQGDVAKAPAPAKAPALPSVELPAAAQSATAAKQLKTLVALPSETSTEKTIAAPTNQAQKSAAPAAAVRPSDAEKSAIAAMLDPKAAKAGDTKITETKTGEAKTGEAKTGEVKAADTKTADVYAGVHKAEALTASKGGPLAALTTKTASEATDTAATTTSSLERARGGSSGNGSLGAVVIPGLLLGALAVAAYVFARRRRILSPKYIEILETASLGPKRALVVAKVGEETLILGTSEAGIHLIKAAPPAVAAALGANADQPLTEALADIPEPEATAAPAVPPVAPRGTGRLAFKSIDGGVTAAWPRSTSTSSRDDEAVAADERVVERTSRAALRETSAPEDDRTSHDVADSSFEDILEDSFEDQELRQKLAAGLAARVR